MEMKRATQALTLNLTRREIERLSAERSGEEIVSSETIELARLVLEKAAKAAEEHLAAQAAAEGEQVVIKLRPVGCAPWLILEVGPADMVGFAEEMRSSAAGERFEIETGEMTRAEIEALPEFEGW